MSAQRRSYGTGTLFERTDSAGRVSWYGNWRSEGVQVKRRIGPKRSRARGMASHDERPRLSCAG